MTALRQLLVFTFMDHGMSRVVAVVARNETEAVRSIISDRAANGVVIDASVLEFLDESEVIAGTIVVDSEVQS